MALKMKKWQEFVENKNFMNNQNYIISEKKKYILAENEDDLDRLLIFSG